MSMRIKPSHILLFIFILIAVTVRIYMFLNTDYFEAEEAFRRLDSYTFATHPLKIFRDTSLICTTSGCQRGFLFLNSLLMHFVDDPVLMPRLSSLIFGILVIIPYYLLVSSVFSQEIALASVFALAFYPVHVQLSVTSLGNAGAIFFVILSAYFFTRYLQINNIKENKIYLTASIIFAALATSFRAETSLLIIIFSLILLQERRFKAAIIFFIFSYTYVISRLWIERGFLCFLHVATGFENWNWPFNLFSAHTELSGLGKIRFFIWFDRLFHSFSLPLSVLGFLGIVSAFKNKKQYMVFLSCFFGFFIFLTIRDLIHTSTPFMRYSSFFTMFFIPFIFLGISRIVAFVYRAFCLENNSKSILIVIFIIIVNTYFAFFSTRYLIKEIPGMKYLAVERALADWISKNLNSGDVVFCSFDSTEHVSALLCNKFINIDYYYFFDINNKYKLDLDAVTLSQLKSFVEQCHIITPTSYGPQGEAFHIFLITKRGQPWEAKRVVFILNDYDYNYLNDNFPNLLEKIEIKYDGFFYSGSLMLEYAYVNKVGG